MLSRFIFQWFQCSTKTRKARWYNYGFAQWSGCCRGLRRKRERMCVLVRACMRKTEREGERERERFQEKHNLRLKSCIEPSHPSESTLRKMDVCFFKWLGIWPLDLASGSPSKLWWAQKNLVLVSVKGRGCGAVGRAVGTNTRDPWFESFQLQNVHIYITRQFEN